MPWWLDKDLRQAPIFHAAFFIACAVMIYFLVRQNSPKKSSHFSQSP
jgi:hypothetical protein